MKRSLGGGGGGEVTGLPQPPDRRPVIRPPARIGPKKQDGKFYGKPPRRRGPRPPKALRAAAGYAPRRRRSMWGLLRKIIRILRKGGRTSDFRNHGFKNSGYKGRTGFAGMKPRRAW